MAGFFRSLFSGKEKSVRKQQNNQGKSRTKATVARMRTIRRENSTDERKQKEVAKEDLLLSQIDEFRERAQQLQEMLLSKEHKAVQLQTIVDERAHKADDLQQVLNERQQKADEITLAVGKQIDELIDKVSAKMDEIENNMTCNLEKGKRVNEEQAKKVYDALSEIQTQLQGMKDEVNEKIHSENVKCFRNIQDLFKGIDDKLDVLGSINGRVKGLRGLVIAALIFALLNFAGLVGMILYTLGLLNI